ncbi:hypothetical protein NGF19_07860 [Streptomyces sp. RY43-2]|uniref:Phage or prophage related protein n=1 Tax=Streptomyces macrolidinus TaxID=2952607 RepID=A0ABT0ZAC2_9ACTN|nr:hypothetical protein [Streptomyces macrolidinus]MCN9240712.1 hypothetical protein [Streptomyces macrolidinus]
MARIRTFKPETFSSESLAQVSVYAERTFFGLISRADDHGRVRDQPAALCGELWAVRGGRTPVDVEDDLIQLAAANLICRYEDDGGKRYLHVVTWHQHQKINRASRSRLPECPKHGAATPKADATQAHGDIAEPSAKAHGGFTEDARTFPASSEVHETAGHKAFSESSVSTHGGGAEPSMSPHALDLGPRNLDQGTSPSGGASARVPETTSAQQLIAEYAAACAHRPPSGVLGHLGRETARLLAEGIEPGHIRSGLALHRAKGLHPSTLPSLVHEAMNATRAGLVRPESRPNVPAHRAWANPADPAAAYAEEL